MDKTNNRTSGRQPLKCEHCGNIITDNNALTVRTVSTYEDVTLKKHWHMSCYITAAKRMPNTPFAAQFKQWVSAVLGV